MKRKNILLTLMFACCPGFGQMYQGYMKRGVSLLFWFIAIIAGGVLLNMGAIAVLAIVVWAYAFFDTFNIRNLSEQQRAYFYDEYIPNSQWLAEHNFDKLLRRGSTSRVFGWVLIVIGIVTLWNSFIYSLAWSLYEFFPGLYTFVNRLPTLVIALLVIFLGVKMIRRSGGGAGHDDVVPFGRGNTPQNPADYMPQSNTPPAPWDSTAPQPQPAPEQPTPEQPAPDLTVDSEIVLQTTTGDEILNGDDTAAEADAETGSTENEDESNA